MIDTCFSNLDRKTTPQRSCIKIVFVSLAVIVVIFQIGFNVFVLRPHDRLIGSTQQGYLSASSFRRQLGGYVEVFGDGWDLRNATLFLANEQRLESELRAGVTLERSKWKGDSWFCIIVLGWKRHASLRRLLDSLAAADYLGERVDLHIKIDGGSGADWEQSIEAALRFHWAHGKKRCMVRATNEGLMRAWLSAWDPIDDLQRAMILEDDMVVSPVWYKWVKLMYKTHGRQPHIAGVSLQRQQIRATDGAQLTVSNGGEPFGYMLVGSWGFSPHPGQWREFIRLDWSSTDPFVPGLVTSSWFRAVEKDSMWTQYFIHFCNRKSLYTIFLTPDVASTGRPHGMAANFREAGEHYGSTQGQDVVPVPAWNSTWDRPPAELPLFGFDLKRVHWCHGLPAWAGFRHLCLFAHRVKT